jgi:hypothetical protein
MRVKYFLFFAVLFSLIDTANAQRVGRKGVTPVQRGNGNNTSQKKSDYTLAGLQGKWQEFKRTDYHGNEVGFTDSIQLKFTDTNKVQTRTSVSNSMTMTGIADIDGDNNLTVASDAYTIKSFANNELVLDDNDKYLHQLKKVDEYWYETLGKLSVKQDTYNNTVKVTLKDITGKWSIYKRQAKPGAITNDMELIKYLNITTKVNDSTASGDLTFYQGQSSQESPCTVTLSGSDIKIMAGQHKWALSIYQADANNFIFGNEGLLYFSKAEH